VTVDGRWARFYIAGERGAPDRFSMAVTYHRPVRGKRRQMSVSPRLLARMLRT
jgi:hypothetical protein